MSWYSEIQTNGITLIKRYLNDLFIAKYPNLFVTTEDMILQEPKFPTVYIEFLQSQELARDLQSNSVNALRIGIQFTVTASKEQGFTSAEEIADALSEYLSVHHFSMIQIPELRNNSQDTKRKQCRGQRVIGSGEAW